MIENRIFLFRVEDQAARVRLDLLIPRLLPDLSRSRAQKMIRDGLVTVNDRPATKHYLARSSDLLRITLPQPETTTCLPENIPVRILYEDEDILAVDKPSGMVVHPAPGHAGGTLVNALLYQVSSLSTSGGLARPGIVHRLDKDTSGIVLVAKNDGAHRRLASQFARRKVEKTYLAMAAGHVEPAGGQWEMALGRDRRERKKISPRTRKPRPAVTRYHLLRQFDGACLLKLHPETGRTHQIRVHLAESGHPVLGDPLYGPKPRPRSFFHEQGRLYGFTGRLALHAWKISCRHPVSEEPLHVEAPLPPALEKLLPP